MAQEPEKYVVDFPTLWVAVDWTEAHCVIPDRDLKGQPFVHYDWQLWFSVNWYRIKPEAKRGQLATAFHSRRAQLVGPQKYGKGPQAGALVVAQARGPVVFDGWAEPAARSTTAPTTAAAAAGSTMSTDRASRWASRGRLP
jgi:hypothetical protein